MTNDGGWRSSLYLCDNKFHTEALSELLESDSRFGFIVMDGNGTLFGTLAGNTREVIHKFTVDLPKKHGRGGQSALRFSRLRDEKRHNYVRKVAELAVQHFITNDKVNVTGLVLAGSADFKTELSQSDMFDPRLAAKVIKVVDVSYGGENGFNQVRVTMSPLLPRESVLTLPLRSPGYRSGRRIFGQCQVCSGEEVDPKVF
jgi:peptide chain release factor subunit 1